MCKWERQDNGWYVCPKCLAETTWPTQRICEPYNAEQLANARLIAAAPRMFDRILALAAEGDPESQAIVEAVNGRA